MTHSREQIISEIQIRYQILITVSGFYSVILYNFFHLNDTTNSDLIFLQVSAFIVYYTFDWLCFELMKNKADVKHLKYLSLAIVFLIGSFLPAMGMAVGNQVVMPFWEQILFFTCNSIEVTAFVALAVLPFISTIEKITGLDKPVKFAFPFSKTKMIVIKVK